MRSKRDRPTADPTKACFGPHGAWYQEQNISIILPFDPDKQLLTDRLAPLFWAIYHFFVTLLDPVLISDSEFQNTVVGVLGLHEEKSK